MKKTKRTNIAMLRQIAGLTQAQLADTLSVAARTVERWESGTRKISPSMSAAIHAAIRALTTPQPALQQMINVPLAVVQMPLSDAAFQIYIALLVPQARSEEPETEFRWPGTELLKRYGLGGNTTEAQVLDAQDELVQRQLVEARTDSTWRLMSVAAER